MSKSADDNPPYDHTSDVEEDSPLLQSVRQQDRPQHGRATWSHGNIRTDIPTSDLIDESSGLLQNQYGPHGTYTTGSNSPYATRSAPWTPNPFHRTYSKRRTPGLSRNNSLRFYPSQTFSSERHRRKGYTASIAPSEKTSLGDEHLWYDQFTSIDWVQENIADAARRKDLLKRKDIRGRLLATFNGLQSWLCAAIVGLLTALVAFFIDVTETTLFDYKFGYCKTNILRREKFCCDGMSECDDWVLWSDALHTPGADSVVTNFAIFFAFMVGMATICGLLVLMTKTVIPAHATMRDFDLGQDQDPVSGRPQEESTPAKEPLATYYTASGSGVAEVRVILSGFVMHGLLGTKTLIIKILGCILSVASGLSVGKEGPYVHIATCIGNIVSRAFPKYRSNAAKRREIISASAAAGVAVAFGSPIGGVLFSLEEVSYYFPAKTLFRTFFCSIIAAVALKFLNPYGTHQIVLFQVRYTSDFKFFELVLFIILGALGGLIGAFFIKASAFWSRTFRRLSIIKRWPLLEVVIVAIISAIVSFWNKYTAAPVAALLFELASECGTESKSNSALCPSRQEMPETIRYLLWAFVIKTILTIITFGIKVPSGIYVPSLVIGGLLGRLIGHLVQFLIMTYVESDIFGTCPIDSIPESCVVPGVYALVAAGATMCGVTRLTVTLAVILFELTGSLDHVLPFSIAILVAKWVADAIEPRSIYDLLTEMNSYPFLDNKKRPGMTGEIAEITPRSRTIRTIDVSNSPLVEASVLRQKVEHLLEHGGNDSALPILKNDVLIGLVAVPDLEFALDKLDNERADCLISPQVQMQGNNDDDNLGEDLTDFRPYVDSSPIALDIHSSMELAYELFAKLGLRYICVLRNGLYEGIIHKKAFVKYTRDVEQYT